MAKKKRKTPVPPEVKLRRKIKKYTNRAIKIGLIVIGYFWLLPLLVPSYAPKVQENKTKLIQAANIARDQAYKILGTATEVTSDLSSASQKVEGEGGAEAVVQNAIQDFKEKVKAIPGEQVKKAKREFCSDVIEEIEQASITPSPQKEE